ncbi:MAG: universal stress protein [Anaerolineae bacterium]
MYRTILVPLDGSALGEGALPTAALLARRMDACLVLARVASDASSQAVHAAQRYLDRVRERLTDAVPVATVVPHGTAAHGILDAITADNADLVVMTTHGHAGLRRLVFGSVAEKVLAASPVPVWLVPARGTAHPSLLTSAAPQILVLLDGSPLAESALPSAVTVAQALGGGLLLLRVVPTEPLLVDPGVAEALAPAETETEEGAEAYLAGIVQGIKADGMGAQFVVRRGSPTPAILDEIWSAGADALVMATHGRSGLDRALLGSVAIGLVHSCTIPMLLTRPPNG